VIRVEIDNRSGLAVDEDAVADACRRVLEAEGVAEGDLGVAFEPPERMRDLKREHLGIDEATDVLSFPVDTDGPTAGPRELGDVVICPEYTRDLREAVVHGVLHLCGYDHETDSGEMLSLQDRVMELL
jgi:probable rRNA maturation factor